MYVCTTETVQSTELKYPLQPSKQHVYYNGCESGDCGGTCYYCTLSICKVCGGAEGSLTSDCPGTKITGMFDDMIYGGVVDYRNGNWLYGFRNRGMYKSPFDYIETEKLFQEVIKAQPSLDMFAVKESKNYQRIGEDWLKSCHEKRTERDLKYIDMLTKEMTPVLVMQAIRNLDYQNSLSDDSITALVPDTASYLNTKPSRDAIMIALQAGSNIKEFIYNKHGRGNIEFVTNKRYPELGAHIELEKYEWTTILATLTTDKMINNKSYKLLQKAIIEIIRPTWER